MQEHERDAFYEIMMGLGDIYTNQKYTANGLRLWFSALQRFELSSITKALTIHINDPDSGMFPPKPADVVRNIEGTKLDRSELAWTKFDKAVRSVGQVQTVVFDDPIIHRVVEDIGGWISFSTITDDDYKFKHNEFVKRYQGYVLNPPDVYPKSLVGIEESSNAANGQAGKKKTKPVLIGDVDGARRVYKLGSSDSGVELHRLSDYTRVEKLEDRRGSA